MGPSLAYNAARDIANKLLLKPKLSGEQYAYMV